MAGGKLFHSGKAEDRSLPQGGLVATGAWPLQLGGVAGLRSPTGRSLGPSNTDFLSRHCQVVVQDFVEDGQSMVSPLVCQVLPPKFLQQSGDTGHAILAPCPAGSLPLDLLNPLSLALQGRVQDSAAIF